MARWPRNAFLKRIDAGRPRFHLVHPSKPEHCRQMRAIGGACLGKARIVFDQEVVPVGKADTALGQAWQIARWIFNVDRDI